MQNISNLTISSISGGGPKKATVYDYNGMPTTSAYNLGGSASRYQSPTSSKNWYCLCANGDLIDFQQTRATKQLCANACQATSLAGIEVFAINIADVVYY